MDDALQRKLGRNESLFREANESIARGRWPGEDTPVRFRCECARLSCNEAIELTTREYEGVRAHPARFLVRDGHELPEVEIVVERRPGYLVVEKRDEAGVVAAELDSGS